MATIVIPDVDKTTIADLRKRLSKVSDMDLPSLEKAGKRADVRINRMRGRSRNPVWPWIAAGFGLVALAGTVAGYLYWLRRPSWDTSRSSLWGGTTMPLDDTLGGTDQPVDLSATRSEADKGLTAAESSMSSTYPLEEA